MEITSVCPYCGKEMRDGAIPAYRSDIYWRPKNEDGTIADGWGDEGKLLLGKPELFSAGYTPAYYCVGCDVVIVPVPEIRSIVDKAGRWLNKTIGALGDKMDKAAERREEEQAARKREEKRKKDPWEV